MYLINGTRYLSPLSQVQGVLQGTRKYANVSIMGEMSGDNHPLSSPADAEVPA